MSVTLDRAAEQVDTEPGPRRAQEWQREYSRALVLLDLAMLLIAAIGAVIVRFRDVGPQVKSVNYIVIAAGLVVVWSSVLAVSRCYEARFLGHGTEEYKRVANASVRFAGTLTFICYAFKLPLSRGFVGVALLGGSVLLVAGRLAARRWVHGKRRLGQFTHRVIVVGTHPHNRELVRRLRLEPDAGYVVVGACVPGGRESRLPGGSQYDVPVVGHLAGITEAIAAARADTVAVTASPGIGSDSLRQLSYELEGSGVDLIVAPALTNVAGTRVSIRPVAGLPLLHVDEPELGGARKVIKGVFDRVVAGTAILLMSPLLLALAILVRVTSRGPAFFRQERVGRDGKHFRVIKYRSMYVDAEARKAELEAYNEMEGGPLFKMREDPRITRIGKFLRKYSLDELPQLFNVMRGEMSLVGPRPPLQSEVDQYEGHAGRRLMVKPGITGLWQVSGRSDLSWDDTVRLDLQYVESWSLALDIAVLFRTVSTVLQGRGAY